MILNIEKLQHLWKSRSSPRDEDSPFVQRLQQIYDIVEGWERAETAIATIGPTTPPKDNGIPADPWSDVKNALLEMYDQNEELKPFISQVDEVEELLHVKSPRSGLFRISSNAHADSLHETSNTTPNRSNPESYYASYNYPFEIVRFFLAVKHNSNNSQPLRYCGDGKFVSKFLWMLANRKEAVPIFRACH
jgi:hypothetical protein